VDWPQLRSHQVKNEVKIGINVRMVTNKSVFVIGISIMTDDRFLAS